MGKFNTAENLAIIIELKIQSILSRNIKEYGLRYEIFSEIILLAIFRWCSIATSKLL